MTISVTPNPTATPPSCTVTVSITAGFVMSSVAIYRNDHNGRTALRTQPAAGFDSRTVTDIECPYEENVTYDWTTTYTDPSGYGTLFNETWASLASWTQTVGTWNVSSGKVRNTSYYPTLPQLDRSFAAAKYRVTIASLTRTSGSGGLLYLLSPSSLDYVRLDLQIDGSIRLTVYIGGSLVVSTATTISGSSPITIDYGTSSVTVSGTGGSYVVPYDLTLSGIRLLGFVTAANAFLVGAIQVLTYPAPTSLAQTSSPVSLDPDDAWLIHPGSSGLSIPMSNTDPTVAGIRSFGDVSNESNATVHRILGSATPIPTTTGPRADDTGSLVIYTATSDERAALRALLAPDVPILINVPPSWETDFNMGFYQVGETHERRDWPWITESVRDRYFDLPITRVQSPVVDVENTGWSYASLAAEFLTYTDLPATFATYAALASNSRI